MLPALLASGILSFVVAMESFEIPQLLGTPAKIFVFTTRIYDLAYGGHVANFGAAMVLALLLLRLTLSLIVVQWRLLRGRAYTTVSGRGYQARPIDLGPGDGCLCSPSWLLRRLRRAAVRGAAAELVHGAERLHQLGDAHDPALDATRSAGTPC